ncbi:exonuclease domain-containing protein [Saccharibacillus deserti]|uniref:exonuclease domain-containing protein n=1 Tax=Saccharibacillus deserti TaxID=1634444 RepID=UPI001551D229|nr:exonuclease domain-containing protein [Saccharibacillus deserti]
MKEPAGSRSGFWNMLRSGGVPSAVASVFGGQSAHQMAFIRSLSREQRRPEALITPLTELETVVFDLETTGFNCQKGDEILSFGAVKMRGDQVLERETFYTLVNPRIEIPPHITDLTGITPEMVEQAPSLIEALHGFMAFIGHSVLVAHASAHDKAFLNTALWKTSKAHLTHRVIDTMMIARLLNPARGGYGLDELLQEEGIEIKERHHALGDSLMTAKLWGGYMNRVREEQISTLGDLYARLSNA